MWQLRSPAFAASLRESHPRATLTFSSTCSSSKFLFPRRASREFASLRSLVERQSAPTIPPAKGSEDPTASPQYKGRLPPIGGDLLSSGDTFRSRARSPLDKGLLASLSCGERLHRSSHQSPSRSLRRGRSPCCAASHPRLRLPPELLPTERLVPAAPHHREAGLGLPAPGSLLPEDEGPRSSGRFPGPQLETNVSRPQVGRTLPHSRRPPMAEADGGNSPGPCCPGSGA
jgi:hypothetical protein